MKQFFKYFFMVLSGLFVAMAIYQFATQGVVDAGLIGANIFATGSTGMEAGSQSQGVMTDEDDPLTDAWLEKNITKYKPDRFPMDTLYREAVSKNRVKVPSMRFDFYEQDIAPISDEVNGAITVGNAKRLDIAVDNPSMWRPNDVAAVMGVKGYLDDNGSATATEAIGMNLAIYIHEVNFTTSKITATPVNGKLVTGDVVFADNIPDNTKLIKLGNSVNDTDLYTIPMSFTPELSYNYCQRIMLQVERTKVDQMMYKDRGLIWGINDDLDLAAEQHRMTSSTRLLFNPRRKTTGNDGKPRYFTGGLLNFGIGQMDLSTLTKSDAVSGAQWQKMTREIFEGNGGSAQRALFCGGEFLEYISQFESIQKQLDAKNSEVKFGITFNRVATSFGELVIMRDPILKYAGKSKDAYWVDFENIGERYFEAEKTTNHDLEDKGIRKTDAIVIDSTCGLSLRYAKTHGYITGPSAFYGS